MTSLVLTYAEIFLFLFPLADFSRLFVPFWIITLLVEPYTCFEIYKL